MEYRVLGRTGLKVSALSFGVGRLTDPTLLRHALDMGVNFFDTAPVYGNGESEKLLGRFLAGNNLRDSFLVEIHYDQVKALVL